MRRLTPVIVAVAACATQLGSPLLAQAGPELEALEVYKVSDFELGPLPVRAQWSPVPVVTIPRRKGSGLVLGTRLKIAYSDTGLYLLVEIEDTKLTASLEADYADLWTEDVFEVFLWPDEDLPLYFEYEISPLGYELPLLVVNSKGNYQGWRPWGYEGERKIRKKLFVFGENVFGRAEKNQENIEGWVAEIFIPFALLEPLGNVPPKPGDRWRANFYRLDYDQGEAAVWAWKPVEGSFHETGKFGTLVFK